MALLEAFVDTTLPADQFHHRQHVEVAWRFVRNYGMPAALGEFTTTLKVKKPPRAVRRRQGCDRALPRDHHVGVSAADRGTTGEVRGRTVGGFCRGES